ncbi:MAG TPA: DUF167 domain-containing protein [Gemmatimonadales bacterium]
MAGGVLVRVHVQPRASRTEVVGRHGDAIKIRLKAPPVDGAANEELLRFLAERLGTAGAAVTLIRGATSRAKTVAISGRTEQAVAAALVPPATNG